MGYITAWHCQILGIIAFCVVLWNIYGIIEKSTVWIASKGTLIGFILRIHEQYDSHTFSFRELKLYHGQYEYIDLKGKKHIHISESGFGGKYPELGTTRIIYYDKNNPRKSRESYESGNELNYLGVVFGGIFLITAIYLYASIGN